MKKLMLITVAALTLVARGEYKVSLNGAELKLEEARISAMPFNRVWPGKQRSIDQTRMAKFVQFDLVGKAEFKVEFTTQLPERALLLPLSRGELKREGNSFVILLDKPEQFILDFGANEEPLHVFVNKPWKYKPKEGDIYFGAGEHDAGIISPKSGQRIVLDHDAVVYGAIFAYNVDNIEIVGRGILDNSKIGRQDEEAKAFRRSLGLGEYDTEFACGAFTIWGCNEVKIEGIVIRDTPFWSLIVRNGCRRVDITNVKVIGQWRYNSDGFDICASEDVTIRDSFLRTFDDCMVARGAYLTGETTPVRNMIVENCNLWCDWGKNMEVWAGHLPTLIENVTYRKNRLLNIAHTPADVTTWYGSTNTLIRNIVFEDIEVDILPGRPVEILQKGDEHKFEASPKKAQRLFAVTHERPCKNLDNQQMSYEGDFSAYRALYTNICFRGFHIYGEKLPLKGIVSTYGFGGAIHDVRASEDMPEYELETKNCVLMNSPKLELPEPQGGWQSKAILLHSPEKDEIPRFCRFIETTLSQYDIDTIVLLVRYKYQFKSHPEVVEEGAIDADDVKAILAACRKVGIELVPKMNLLGHQSGNSSRDTWDPLLLAYPELDESPDKEKVTFDYCRCLCPRHPKALPLVRDLVIELSSVFEAKKMHIGCDEVFEIGHCSRCKEINPGDIFSTWVNSIADILRAQGVQTMIWADRLLNGAKLGYGPWESSRNGVESALGKVAKDVILCDWHYEAQDKYPSVEEFANAGYKMYLCPWRYVPNTKRFLDYAVKHNQGNCLGVMLTTWTDVKYFMDALEGKSVDIPGWATAPFYMDSLKANFNFIFKRREFTHSGFYLHGGGVDNTVFRWGMNDGRLNFSFDVKDDTPCDVAKPKEERELDFCDRVELYFSPTGDLSKPYYAIEMDASGNVLDYSVVYGQSFNYGWKSKTVKTKAKRTADGYWVKGTIELSELRELGIEFDRFWMGAFRADFKEGGELGGWYSYLPSPSGRANFHTPQMFFPVALSRR